MKICPQCNVAYQDDYVFCLSDGNSLLDESGEQETRMVNRIVFPERTSALSPDMLVACVSCGLANRARSKFCKKCGVALSNHAQMDPDARRVNNQTFRFDIFQGATHSSDQTVFPNEIEPTIAFQRGQFVPPQSNAENADVNQRRRQMLIAFVAILIVLVIIIAAFLFNSGTENSRTATNSKNSNSTSKSNSLVNSRNFDSNRDSNVPPSEVGRTGRLTINTNIRAASNKDAEIRGTHYQGARVEVLDVDSYSTNRGVTTWYRVRVLENGCDVITNHGCGNNWERNRSFGWMEADTEGWMNAKHINLN